MSILNQLGQVIADFFGESSALDLLSEEKTFESDFLDPDYLSDLLPYRLYDPGRKIFENKSSFGFVLEVIPVLGAGKDSQQEISLLMKEIGEEGSCFQCLMLADNRVDLFLDSWKIPREKRGGIFKKVADKKIAFINQESLKGEIPPRIFRFFFSYSHAKPSKADLPIFLEKLVEKKKKAVETFSRLSHVFEMKPAELISLLSGMVNFDLNPITQTRKAWNQDTWISKQVCLPGGGIEVKKDGLLFCNEKSEAAFKTYEAVDFPDEWMMAFTGELIGDFFNASYRLPAPFFLHFGIHVPNQQKTETKFRAREKVVNHQAKFPAMMRMIHELPREVEENLYVSKQLLDGEKFVETRLSCGLWAEKSRFLKAESTLVSLFQKYGFKLKENHFIHLPDFLSSLPMTWGESSAQMHGLKRTRCLRTTLTFETGNFVPLVGEWWGNSTQGMILQGRRGQLASWDPFASEGNLNAVVIGPSGSGKSVFMQEMIMNQLGQGGRVFVLDLGRSFEKLCHLLDGEYLIFSAESKLNLNPFYLLKDNGDIESLNAGLDMVSSIIATMAMPAQKIDKERADILSYLVKLAWEKKGRNATVDDVILLLDGMKFQSELMIGATESLKEGLRKFGREGIYANYFYGSHPVDFKSDLVVIETEELKNMSDLQAVILQIFALTISNQVFMGDREKRCMICIDEAWDLLKSPQMEGFIESLARRLRKYNGSLVVGTQGLKDFERSHGARAAFQNSNWLLMLGSDNDSINILKKENLISMDDYKERMLSSLKKEDGKYSEVFIYHKGSGFHSINQLRLDPFSAMLYSTKASDFQAILELKKLGMEVEEAIEWMLSNRRGFKELIENGHRIKESIQHLLENHSNHTEGVYHVKK
jgi:conjugal transfer ATP-binding protein TraC